MADQDNMGITGDVVIGRCSACLFWKRILDPTNVQKVEGQCRRYPPTFVSAPGQGILMVRPNLDQNDVCGEFRPGVQIEGAGPN